VRSKSHKKSASSQQAWWGAVASSSWPAGGIGRSVCPPKWARRMLSGCFAVSGPPRTPLNAPARARTTHGAPVKCNHERVRLRRRTRRVRWALAQKNQPTRAKTREIKPTRKPKTTADAAAGAPQNDARSLGGAAVAGVWNTQQRWGGGWGQ